MIIHYRSSAAEAEELAATMPRAIGRDAWTDPGRFLPARGHRQLSSTERTGSRPARSISSSTTPRHFPSSTLDNLTLDTLLDSVKTDAWAPFALSRNFARQPGAEHIVNILDTRITSSHDWTHVGYLAAKHMLYLFTRMMAVKFAPRIAVNAVAPGLILPPEGKGMDYLESLKDKLPAQTHRKPQSGCRGVLFLVRSEFITGQVIYVDGGRHLNEA